MDTSVELLRPSSVGDYLFGRSLVVDSAGVQAAMLAGGVSNVVIDVTSGDKRFVVKQSLELLRVADEWRAPRSRVLTEAAALALAGELTPGAVPRVVDVDSDACVIVLQRAPTQWRDWKTALLTAPAHDAVAVDIARSLGEHLARWHSKTTGQPLDERFDDYTAFDALRIDPYYRTVMQRVPAAAAHVQAHLERLATRRLCLVHGDFSPKNVLTGPDGLWVIDFETAHKGDPVFDVAFLLTHLLLKSVHRPASATTYRAAADAFVSAYRSAVPDVLQPDPHYLAGQVACLLLARTDGKSPAEYLTEQGKTAARALAMTLFAERASDAEIWALKDAEVDLS